MKSLYYTWFFILLVAFISLNATFVFAGNGVTDNDSIHTIKYIESISITDPHRALQVIDEAEALGRLPQYSLDQLRGIVYQNGLGMSRTSLLYTLKAYRNDSIRRYPGEVLLTLRSLTYQYNNIGNYTESTRYAFEGIELAREKSDKESEARFRLNVAINKRDMGLKKEAEPYLAESARLMEQAVEEKQSARKVDGLIYIYGMIATFAYEDGEYQKAIDLLPRYLRVMELFKSRADNVKGRYEMRLTSIYIMYASIFAANGQMEKAEEYYRKFDAMEYAHTQDGNQMRFEYLVTTRRYRDALRFIHADKEYYRAQGDTINYFYVDRTLHLEAKAYMGLGDYQNAAQTYKQMYDLADSLRIREKQNGVLEFAAIYETKEKEAELVEQTARLHESRMISLFTGCLVVLLGVLLWRTVRHMRIIRQKNLVMVRTIREQLACKDELLRREEEIRSLQEQQPQMPEDYTDAMMRGMFDRAKYEIMSRKLYLRPDFSREELIETVHIPQNKFAGLFKKYTGFSFSKYINKLRLERAAHLLEEHPEYSIEAIAENCGISSTTTFYRLFFEEYGMTPKNFRDSLKRAGNEGDNSLA